MRSTVEASFDIRMILSSDLDLVRLPQVPISRVIGLRVCPYRLPQTPRCRTTRHFNCSISRKLGDISDVAVRFNTRIQP